MIGLDLAYLRGWIGREQVVDDVVTEELARRYRATFDLSGPTPKAGETVPRLIHFCLAQSAVTTDGLGADGHSARGGFLPPVQLPRRMWAGGALTFRGDLRVGDAVTRISRVQDVEVKEGRTGTLCFVTVSHRVSVAGELRVDERQDIVYRTFEAAQSHAASIAPAPVGEHTRPMTADATLLFRYSALTFNGHRIHYDRRYATGVECYPGLVVQGPMQAALMLNFATELNGRSPSRFSFRGQSPLFDDEAFVVHASGGISGLRLWTAKSNGPICMSAEAQW